MAGHVASGEVEGAAECDGRVGEIAADAVAAFDDFGGGKVRTAGTETVLDIVVDPIADCLHALDAMFDLAELVPGEVHELVRIAITARQRVAQKVSRKVAHGND